MQIYITLNYRQLGIPKVDHEVLIPSRDFEKNTATFEMELLSSNC